MVHGGDEDSLQRPSRELRNSELDTSTCMYVGLHKYRRGIQCRPGLLNLQPAEDFWETRKLANTHDLMSARCTIRMRRCIYACAIHMCSSFLRCGPRNLWEKRTRPASVGRLDRPDICTYGLCIRATAHITIGPVYTASGVSQQLDVASGRIRYSSSA